MQRVAQEPHDRRRADQIDRYGDQQDEVRPEERPIEPGFAGLYPIPEQIACQSDDIGVFFGEKGISRCGISLVGL